MTDFGITALGAYIPWHRIARSTIADAHAWMAPGLRAQAKGRRAYCAWDEDAITMAVEAARGCADQAARADTLYLASTTYPYADLQNASVVAAAIGLPATTRSIDIGNSQRAGTGALIEALQAGRPALVIASDKPFGKPASTQELGYGAAAAALAIGADGVVAKLVGSASLTSPFVDHFRASTERFDYYWEERWIRDEGYLKIVPAAVKAALASSGLAIGDIAHFVLASPMRGIADAVARKIGFAGTVATPLDDGCGYAGAAQPLLMLADTIERAHPGERILLVGFGQGADALLFERTAVALPAGSTVAEALASGQLGDSYERMLSAQGGTDLDWGMRAEKSGKTPLTEQYRSADQVAAFVAGKCGNCGTIQFPQLQYCVEPSCNAPSGRFEDVPMAGLEGKVVTYTADWLSYHPSPPNYVGFVQYGNGVRLLMEMVNIGPEGVDVGTVVRPAFRIKERDTARGYNRYFWKAAPVRTVENN
jgi:3-hydroxy-3-methylglutaryl CoA synthase/uncharacterized OB-fold protein